MKKLFSRRKKPMTLEEYAEDCLAKGETREDLQKRLLSDLDKGEGIFKDFREFLKPTFPNSDSRFFEDRAKHIKWDEKLFQKSLDLYNELRKNKKEKNWRNLISICEEIIQLDDEAKVISISLPLCHKDMAKAYEKLDDIDNALKYYHLSKESFLKYRNENTLSNPDDWLKDIAIIDKRILKLASRKVN
jgi:tetratricopeptide (TPR) repeat protein